MELDYFAVEALSSIKQRAPLIHSITNLVVMNSSANILLAAGASPVMAHSASEVEEMTARADALVLNTGTPDDEWLESMILAGRKANEKGIPIVFDPAGAGATSFRSRAAERILESCRVSVIRGNASEMLSLASREMRTRGVESWQIEPDEVEQAAKGQALERGCIAAVSGEVDCITDGRRLWRIKNGQQLMSRITGLGCGLSSVTAAFCAVSGRESVFEASAAAFAFYGLCGDLAVTTSDLPGSFYTAFLDRLYSTGKEEIKKAFKLEEVS